MRNFKAAIFDLDGTLLDTLTALWYCSSESLKKEGLKTLPLENYKYYVGDGSRKQVERYLHDTDIDPDNPHEGPIPDPHDPANLEYYFESYMKILAVHSNYNVKPFDGIPKVLENFKKRGMGLGVLSNKPHSATKKLIYENFGNTFDFVLGGGDHIPRKPDPVTALITADVLGAKPEEVMYFGDTDTDMQTGRNAGMFTVGVLWGFRPREELLENGAEVLAEKPLDILNLLS